MSIIFSKLAGANDPYIGKFEHTIKALIDNENTEQLILRHKERTMQRKKRDFKKELAKAFKGMK